jgi:PAS domain S-box-containing protein
MGFTINEVQFYEAVIDTAGDLIIVCDTEGRILRYNQACEQISGYNFDEVQGRHIWEVVHEPANVEPLKALFPNADWSSPGLRQRFESFWITRDGRRRRISWIVTFLSNEEGEAQYAIGTGTDITRQRIMEERLQKSEAELQSIFENANGIIYTLSPEGKFIFVSQGWEEILGHKINEVRGQYFDRFVHPDDIAVCRNFLGNILITGEAQKGVEYRVQHCDGKWRWHTSSGAPVKDENGKPIYYVGLAVDITERKIAEDALYESERRFRDLLENIKLVAIVFNTEGNLIFCNDFLLALSGWELDEIKGKNWFETFVPIEYRERDKKNVKHSLENKTAPAYTESEIFTRTGKRRIILWSNTLLLDINGNPTGYASIGEDITERRLAEEKSKELLNKLELANKELKEFPLISRSRVLLHRIILLSPVLVKISLSV